MRCITFSVVAILILLSGLAHAKSFDSFTWINAAQDAQIYQEIEKTFSDELQPDDPEIITRYNEEKVRVTRFYPCLYKYVAKIGAFQNSFLVLIGYREQKNDPKEYDYFRAYSYDRVSGRKGEGEPKDIFYQWSLIGSATFEPSVTPDIVFKYNNCMECESAELLSSFTLDAKEKKWKKRIWPDNDPHLLIGSEPQYGDDIYTYDCLYKITDFNRDGFSDIGIHCRITADSRKTTKDEIILYTIQKGVAKKIRIEGKKKIEQINAILCKGQDSPLCK